MRQRRIEPGQKTDDWTFNLSQSADRYMRTQRQLSRRILRRVAGFTLEEVVMSMGIALGSVLAVLSGYKVAMYRTEWSLNATAA